MTTDDPDASAPREATDASRAVAPRLLEALVCPLTGLPLTYDRGRGALISRAAGLAFPIRSGIPIMLVDEARKLEDKS
ncbi:MAG: Trm112 family protein [Pseudomonadota bacterium]